jgi:hypothetical protein
VKRNAPIKRTAFKPRVPAKPKKKGIWQAIKDALPFGKPQRVTVADILFGKQFHSPEFVEFTRTAPSAVSGNIPCLCSHSARSRGAGGTYRDVVPLTDDEHREEHAIGVRTFWRSAGRNPKVEARRHWERFLESWHYRAYLRRIEKEEAAHG